MTNSSTTDRRSPLQLWLEFLASTRPDARRAPPTEPPCYASLVQERRRPEFGGWDPYEVWLDRIKRPRDAAFAPKAVKESR
jgi:hypothetical protein